MKPRRLCLLALVLLAGCGARPEGSVSLTVTCDGAPVGEADLRLLGVEGDRLVETALRGRTDARGQLVFPRVPAGTYEVRVERPGGAGRGPALSEADYLDSSREAVRFQVDKGAQSRTVALRTKAGK